MQKRVTPGSVWKHTNGNLYGVLCITNEPDEPRYPKTVVYFTLSNENLWSRPYSDWHRSMTFVSDNWNTNRHV